MKISPMSKNIQFKLSIHIKIGKGIQTISKSFKKKKMVEIYHTIPTQIWLDIEDDTHWDILPLIIGSDGNTKNFPLIQ